MRISGSVSVNYQDRSLESYPIPSLPSERASAFAGGIYEDPAEFWHRTGLEESILPALFFFFLRLLFSRSSCLPRKDLIQDLTGIKGM